MDAPPSRGEKASLEHTALMCRMPSVLYGYKYSVCIDICQSIQQRRRASRGGTEGRGEKKQNKKQKQLMAEKLIGEDPATSREVMKHHHSELTQLF